MNQNLNGGNQIDLLVSSWTKNVCVCVIKLNKTQPAAFEIFGLTNSETA